jgi:hypothetical protein
LGIVGWVRFAFLVLASLLLSGCSQFFSDYVNYGFSQQRTLALFAFFGGSVIEADIEPLYDEPPIILGNGISESARVSIPDGPFILPVGNPFVIGDLPGQSCLSRILGWEISELSGILRYDIDADEDDNDAEQLIVEIVTGRSGAFFEYERTPGISGVELIGITPDRYTLAFADGDATDTLTLAGVGVSAILRKLDRPADATDECNALSLIDVEAEAVVLGTPGFNSLGHTPTGRLEGREEIQAFLAEVLHEEPAGIRLISAQEQSVSMYVMNTDTGTLDLFIFYNHDGAVSR